MLAKKNRLKKKTDFESVFKNGKSLKEGSVILKYLFKGSKISRFGVVVSKKIDKKTNVRNRIKRKISESIRLRLKNFKKGIDVIVITLPGIEKNDFKEIDNLLDKLFKKSSLYEFFG